MSDYIKAIFEQTRNGQLSVAEALDLLTAPAPSAAEPPISRALPCWIEDTPAAAAPSARTLLIVASAWHREWHEALRRAGHEVIYWLLLQEGAADAPTGPWRGIDMREAGSLDRAVQELAVPVHEVLFVGPEAVLVDSVQALGRQQRAGVFALLRFFKAWAVRIGQRPAAIRLITHNVQWLPTGGAPRNPHPATMIGLGKVAAIEYPGWQVSGIDLQTSPLQRLEDALIRHIDPMLAETVPLHRHEVALREGSRYVRHLHPVAPADASDGMAAFKTGGVYFIAGGLGGLGCRFGEHLARQYRARLLLTGRRPLDARGEQQLAHLRSVGATVEYCPADLGDMASMRQAVRVGLERFGRIDGVIHSALTLADAAIKNLDEERLGSVMRAKVEGCFVLDQVTRDLDLDFILLFSSATGLFGNAGQGAYAAASRFEDAYADAMRSTRRCAVKTINWGFWGESGIVANTAYRERLAKQGIHSISDREGVAEGEWMLRSPHSQLMIARLDPRRLDSAGPAAPSFDIAAVLQQERETLRGALALELDTQGFDLLKREGRRMLLQAWRAMGAFGVAGGSIGSQRLSATALRERLGVLPGQRQLFEEMLAISRRAGHVNLTSDGEWVATPGAVDAASNPGADADVQRHHPQHAGAWRLLAACAEAWPQVLTGQRRATDVMFPAGSSHLVEAVYKGNPTAVFYHRLLESAVRESTRARAAAAAGSTIELLEVGAGTGSASEWALKGAAAAAAPVRYTYTDISEAFVRYGRQQFASRYPATRFQRLDIAQPLAAQGFPPSSVDAVIASNVLHATSDLRSALSEIRRVLRPNGVLIVNEATSAQEFLTLTFGLLEGWWLYEDADLRVQGSPLLHPQGWRTVLREHGFGEPLLLDAGPGSVQTLLIAAAVGTPAQTMIESAAPPRVSGAAPAEACREPTAMPVGNGSVLQALIACARRCLEIDEIDADTPLSELGVDSILAAKLVNDINKSLQLELDAVLLFEHYTLSALAAYIEAEFSQRVMPVGPPATVAALQAPAEPRAALVEDEGTAAARPEPAGDAVAVVGMACRFAGARNLDEFWHNLVHGVCAISEVPAERWRIADHFDTDRGAVNKTYAKWGGYLDDIDRFDPLFFKISPKEAELMDPQQRLFLQAAFHAIEDAGYTSEGIAALRCGVFVGCGPSEYADPSIAGNHPATVHDFTGNHASILPARLSYLLDLSGPCLVVETSCSSSAVAVHLARESLLRGECDVAIAGGVALHLLPKFHVLASKATMLSPTGRCSAFDDAADGFVPGEGVGLVLMERPSQAAARGSHVYGLVRASGVNHDGRTNGITAPSGNAQTELLERVYRQAGIDPGTISCVEAHGTGTELGDPIEVGALTRAFGASTPDRRYCALGSVKSSIGHTIHAAGVAGLIKLMLCLKHRKLAPSVGYTKPNARIDFESSPFYVPTKASDWLPRRGLRRAVLNSFGFSGTNCHLVVDEAPRPVSTHGESWHLATLSAKSDAQLRRRCEELQAWLQAAEHQDESIADICFTLNAGRDHHRRRLAFVVSDRHDLVRQLGAAIAAPATPPSSGGRRDAAAWLADLACTDPAERDAHRRILEAVATCYCAGETPQWSGLYRTQPRRLSLPGYPFERVRCWRRGAKEEAQAPVMDAPASHEVLVEDWVLQDHRVNGQPMLPGAAYVEMARAVAGLSRCTLKNLVWLEPFTPGDGRTELTVELAPATQSDPAAACRRFDIRGASRRLHAQGEIMAVDTPPPSRIDLAAIRQRCTARHSGTELYEGMRKLGLDYRKSFQAVRELHGNGTEALAEIRLPDHLLPGFGRYGLHPVLLDAALQSVAGLQFESSLDGVPVPYMVQALTLHSAPTPRCWAHVHNLRSVPGQHSVDIAVVDEQGEALWFVRGFTLRPLKPKVDAQRVFCAYAWQPAPLPAVSDSGQDVALISRDDSLRRVFEQQSTGHVACVPSSDDSEPLPQSRHLVFDADSFITALSPSQAADAVQVKQPVLELFRLCRRLLDAPGTAPIRLLVLLRQPGAQSHPLHEALAGLVRSLNLEQSRLFARTLAVVPASPQQIVEICLGELRADEKSAEVRHRDGVREARMLREIALPAVTGPAFTRGGVYWIVGGAGGVGRLIARHLAVDWGGRVVLTGRSQPEPDLQCFIAELQQAGASIEYERADAGRLADVEATWQRIRLRHGGVHGVIHCAGTADDAALHAKTAASAEAVLGSKIDVALNLDHVTRNEALECFVCCSSLAALLGNRGQSDYASANRFLDAFMHLRAQWQAEGWRRGRSVSINWPVWAQGGMRPPSAMERVMAERLGLLPLPTATALQTFADAVASGQPQCSLLYGDGPKIRCNWFDPVAAAAPAASAPPAAQPAQATDSMPADPAAVVARIQHHFARLLSIGLDDLDPDQDMGDFGTDSIMLADLVDSLNREYADVLNPSELAEIKTIRALGRLIAGRMPAPTAGPQVAAVEKGPAQSAAQRATVSLPERQPKAADGEIAIVGLACRFPGADDAEQYWELLASGRSAIGEIPAERWDAEEFFSTDLAAPGKSYSKWGGFIDGIADFDARFFEIDDHEAQVMDPQQRQFLEIAYRAVEDAGRTRRDLAGQRGAVFVGARQGQYQATRADGLRNHRASLVANLPNIIATRVSHYFDLKGPALAIDTACSSSLVALHLACESLRRGEADFAIAGGVELLVHPSAFITFSKSRILSPTGRCLPFDRRADGLVVGEGLGAVVLKPLAQAQRDGDFIYGTILGSAINNDGATLDQIPDLASQRRLLAECYAPLGIGLADMDYLEMHGASTSFGDAYELKAVKQVWQEQASQSAKTVVLGAVKANIGHLICAAGIASVIKACLMSRHRALPPSCPGMELSPVHGLEGTPFRLGTVLDSVPAGAPLRIGIHSLGFGGTNCHVVLQSHDDQGPKPAARKAPMEKRRYWVEAEPGVPAAPSDSPCSPAASMSAAQRADSGADGAPPGLLLALQRLCADVVGHDEVDPDANLFDLGLGSVEFMDLFVRLRETLQVELHPTVLSEVNTLRGLADVMARQGLTQPVPAAPVPAPPRAVAPAPAPARSCAIPARARKMDFSLFFFADYGRDSGYDLLLDAARHADDNGYNAIYTPERHFADFGGLYANPAITSAALATMTKRIRLRAGSVVVPLHDPLRLAEEWAMVDRLSNGRVDFSFTCGWQCDDYVLFPDRFEQRHEHMYRAIDEVRRLWRGEAVRRVNGLGKEISVQAYPRPIQAECPLWITSAGAPETFVSAAERNANVLTFLLGHNSSIDQLRDKIDLYRRTLSERGFDPAQRKVAVMLHTYVGEDLQSAKETVRQPLFEYLRSSVGLARNLMRSVDAGVQVDDERQFEAIFPIAFERIFQNAGLLGTAESCQATLDRLSDAGVDEVACLIDFGIERQEVMRGLQRLSELRRSYAGHDAAAPSAPPSGPALAMASAPVEATSTKADAMPALSRELVQQSYRLKQHIPGASRKPAQVESLDGLAIAIVGMACRFPGCEDLEKFRGALRQGRSFTGPVPEDRRARLSAGLPPEQAQCVRDIARWGGFIDLDAACHATRCGLPAEALEGLSLEQQFMLSTARAAVDDAGARHLASRAGSVYIGARRGPALASVVASHLGWQGEAVDLDHHCTSSAIALHRACQRLRERTEEAAIVGGIELLLDPDVWVSAAEHKLLGSTPRVLAFDERGDGIVLAEGVGAVVLKPLARAQADGDRIYGVIRASAVNADSGTFNPQVKVNLQKALMDAVYRTDTSRLSEVEYMECHGVGSGFADAIEVKAIRELFAERGVLERRSSRCGIGSVKTNLGHLNAACGIAGLIKCALMLHDRWLAPLAQPVDQLAHHALEGTTLHIQQEGAPMREDRQLHSVALHAYEYGGTLNHHLLLESAPAETPRRPGPRGGGSREVATELSAMAAQVLETSAGEVTPAMAIADLGFDSLRMFQLAERIEQRWGFKPNPTLFFQCVNLQDVADVLIGQQPERFALANDVSPQRRPQPAPVHAPTMRSGEHEAIAVVGMSGMFPQSEDIDQFWQHLLNGAQLITEVPAERWDWRVVEAAWGPTARPISHWGGFVSGIDRFDPAFFKITPKEAEWMDPQQRLFLQTVWHCIENAGHDPQTLEGRPVGLFVGLQFQDYYDEMVRQGRSDILMMTGNVKNMLPNRISYFMDWHGPSEVVETACSASLVSIHRAVRAIRNGECESAVAGGVSLLLSPGSFVLPSLAGMLSPDGRCHTFDRRANGFVKGEGMGAVWLKPLAAAEADGDHIYAVIKGSATNHGGKSTSLTAPSARAQQRLISAALADAGVGADTVGYIETHGTGTELGDPVEINGLKLAFQAGAQQGVQGQRCAVGSVKSNIGHLEPAAGIAGFIKTALALHHGVLPATVGVENENPYLELEGSPFYIQKHTTPWERLRDASGQSVPRRAGVSSFGFGGSNAHVILQEYAAPAAPVEPARAEIFVLSARDPQRLSNYAERLCEFVQRHGDLSLADLAYTLQVGRSALPERLAFVAGNRSSLLAALQRAAAAGSHAGIHRGRASARPADDTGEEERMYFEALVRGGKLDKVARLWTEGAPVVWQMMWRERRPRRISAPGYPFARERYWLDFAQGPSVPALAPMPAAAPVPAGAASAVTVEAAGGLDFEEKVLGLIAQVTGHARSVLTAATALETDIGLDSIKVMELTARLADLFGRDTADFVDKFSPQRLMQAATIGDLLRSLEALRHEFQGVAASAAASMPASLDAAPPPADVSGSRIEGELPLLHSQYYMLLTHFAGYGQQCSCVRLRGRFDPETARTAWDALVQHHVMLRARFVLADSARRMREFRIEVLEGLRVPPLRMHDLRSLPEALQAQRLQQEVQEVLARESELQRWPLLEVYGWRLAEECTQLFFVVTHLVADGLSMQRLVREFLQAYQALAEGRPPHLAAAPDLAEYRRICEALNGWSSGEEDRALADYVKRQGRAAYLWNPEGSPSHATRPVLSTERHRITAEATRALIDATRAWRMPLQTLLVGAHLRSMQALHASDEPVVLSLPTSGRVYPQAAACDAVGCFAQSIVPSFAPARDDEDWASLLHRVQLEIRTALVNGFDRAQARQMASVCRDHIPLQQGRIDRRMVEKMGQTGHKTNQYLSHIGETRLAERYGPLQVEDYAAYTTNAVGSIDHLVEIVSGRLQITSNYDSSFYSREFVRRFSGMFEQQIKALCDAAPSDAQTVAAPSSIGDTLVRTVVDIVNEVAVRAGLQALTLADRRRDLEAEIGIDSLDLLRTVTRLQQRFPHVDPHRLLGCRSVDEIAAALAHTPNAANEPDEEIPLQRIEAAAAKHPDALAVMDAQGSLSYDELRRQSNQIARFLIEQGVRRGDLVCLLLPRGTAFIAAMLGVNKAGAAYVPLDPAYPPARLETIAAHARARWLITDEAQGRAGLALSIENRLVLDAAQPPSQGGERGARDWRLRSDAPVDVQVRADDLMVVLYTSGSTGAPKGVMLAHAGYMNRLRWHQELFRLQPGEPVAHKTSTCFDISVWEMLWPLMEGGTVCAADNDTAKNVWSLADWMQRLRISVAHFVPSLFGEFLQVMKLQRWRFPHLRDLIFSGEALPASSVRLWFELSGNATRLTNLYGPTEASIDVSACVMESPPDAAQASIPIGGAMPGVHLVAMDDEHRPVAVGEQGQLWIGGVQLAIGYLHDPQKTAAAFQDHPERGRLYATGDLVSLRADGQYEYHGRVDQQVKIRGFRVELGEIEAVLAAHPQVREVGVCAVDADAARKLVAWVACNSEEVDPRTLKEFVAARLPHYMVPHRFVFLNCLPKTPNGKLDRKALVDIKQPQALEELYPAGPAQRWLLRFFEPPFQWSGHTRFRLHEPIDPTRLEQGLQRAADAQPALRTVFVQRDGQWQQRVLPPGQRVVIAFHDDSAVPEQARQDAIRQRIATIHAQLEIDRYPLWRLLVVKLAPACFDVTFIGHHIVCDMVSAMLATRNFLAMARGDAGMPLSGPGYIDYVRRLQEQERAGAFEPHLDYWRRQYAGPASAFTVPFDHEKGLNIESSSRRESFVLDKASTTRLMHGGKKHYRTHLYPLLVAPLYASLAAWTRRQRVVVSHRSHGREFDGRVYNDAIGNFAVNYPVAVELDRDWQSNVQQVEQALAAVPFKGVTYDWLGTRLPEYAYPDDKLTPVRVNYLGNRDLPLIDGIELVPEDRDPRVAPSAQRRTALLEYFLFIEQGCLHLDLGYSSNYFFSETIQRLGRDYLSQLMAMLAKLETTHADEVECNSAL